MKNILFLCFIFCIFWGSTLRAESEPLYKNPGIPTELRVSDLLQRLTLEEKLGQLRHIHSWDILDGKQLDAKKLSSLCGTVSYGFFETFPLTAENCREVFRQIQTYLVENTRLGIPGFPVAESLHGVVHEGATIYPQNIALGSTFNVDLAYEKTRHIAGELNTMGIKQVLAPCIDVVRELRWGRVEESFSEDPFLCSQLGVAEVKGYLEQGISPMLKHYGPHGNPSGGLNLASVNCGVRDLFDIYLKPFEVVCRHSGVMAVMSSYNSWNRMPNSASKFMLTDILRNKFGFRGYVYSDWGVIDMLKYFHHTAADDVSAATQALCAGLDVEASSNCFPALAAQVAEGKFDMQYIDQAVRRVLRAKFESGLFEDPYLEKSAFKLPLRAKESVKLSRRIAEESAVLLKNEGNLLPLDKNKLKSVAVIGPNADQVQFGDYTWSKNKQDGMTPLQGIRNLLKKKVKVYYAKGCSLASMDTTGIDAAVQAAKQGEVALVFVGSSSTAFVRHSAEPSTSGEGIDLHDISLTGAQELLIKRVYETGTPTVVVLVAGKPFAIPWVKEHIPAVMVQWYAGEQEGNAIADLLFGQVNPSGKLSFSFPQSTGHLPVFYNHLPSDKGFYNEPGSYDRPGRDYVFSNPAPLWAFGHGLSYTEFNYLQAVTDRKDYTDHDTIVVRVKLQNTGQRYGKEVVQVYVRDVVSTVVTPVKQLKGFAKVALKPGEVAEKEIRIPVHELYLTDQAGNRYLEPGLFEIQVGCASDHILFTLPVNVGEKRRSCGMVVEKTLIEGEKSATQIRVTGCVRDVQATPVADCKVECLESGTSAMTNAAGCYELQAVENGVLHFSKKQFVARKVPVNKQQSVNVQLMQGNE